MSFADVSTMPVGVVARHVNFPVSSSYVVAIRSTALLPSLIICKQKHKFVTLIYDLGYMRFIRLFLAKFFERTLYFFKDLLLHCNASLTGGRL